MRPAASGCLGARALGAGQQGAALSQPPPRPIRCRVSRRCATPWSAGVSSRRSGRGELLRARAVALDDEDLMQVKDRYKWYEAPFAADDMPDWVEARFVDSEQQAPHVRLVTLRAEVSRERVPLRNAYKAAGQRAVLRVNGGEARSVPVASPPPPEQLQTEALFLLKGDIFAGESKSARQPTSVQATVQVLVEREAAPEVYDLSHGDIVSLGPFAGTGLDTRSSGLLSIFRFPTVVIFASGPAGIAAAAALIESPPTSCTHLSPALRQDVRLYYAAPNRASLCLTGRFEAWAEDFGTRVVPSTAGFADAWDGDDSLVYDPALTAAVVLTGGDAEAEAAALEVCKEAEITTIITDSQPAPAPVYLSSVPKSFLKFAQPSGSSSSSSSSSSSGDTQAAAAAGGEAQGSEELVD